MVRPEHAIGPEPIEKEIVFPSREIMARRVAEYTYQTLLNALDGIVKQAYTQVIRIEERIAEKNAQGQDPTGAAPRG
jgi:hypothetical protein